MLQLSLRRWLETQVPVHLIHLVQLLTFLVVQRMIQLFKARLARYVVEEFDEVLLRLVISLTRAPPGFIHISHKLCDRVSLGNQYVSMRLTLTCCGSSEV